jgi:hypothetical protein
MMPGENGSASYQRVPLGERLESRCTHRVHDIRSQHVLATFQNWRALVQLKVRKHQGHPTPGVNRRMWRAIIAVELRLATYEFLVQVNHERQLTLLAVAALETSIVVQGEFLAWIVSVESKPFVQT